MTSKKQITARMDKIGMAWAGTAERHVSTSDPMAVKVRGTKFYHVHPDRDRPEVTAIMRFRTLRELDEYIDLREKYLQAVNSGDHEYADILREDLAAAGYAH